MSGMNRIVVLGGSVAGLLCGMQLARQGHAVTVLERDVRPAVDLPLDAPPAPRAGAPHAVQAHTLLARAALEIRRALPEVHAALLAAGVGELDLVARMPPAIPDRAPRADDGDLVMLTARRHVLDRVLVAASLATPRLDVRFGVTAVGLVLTAGDDGLPQVAGVQLAGGEALACEVVVDASGRRTPVPRWLAAAGITLPLAAWDCGLVYFTRHYRLRPGTARPSLNLIFAARERLPSLTVAWFLGDNDTAMLIETVLADDALLKAVRHPACFEAVARAVPAVAPWLGCADPITDIFAMGAVQNTLRHTVQDGRSLVLGLHLIGDALATTSPTLGRGLTFAAISAGGVAQAVAAHPDNLLAQALRFDACVARDVAPWFQENAAFDRALFQRMRADLAGQPSAVPARSADAVLFEELRLAGLQDAELYRAAMRYSQLLADPALLAEPSLVERVRRVIPLGTRLPAPVGPSRAELTHLLAAV